MLLVPRICSILTRFLKTGAFHQYLLICGGFIPFFTEMLGKGCLAPADVSFLFSQPGFTRSCLSPKWMSLTPPPTHTHTPQNKSFFFFFEVWLLRFFQLSIKNGSIVALFFKILRARFNSRFRSENI